MLIERLWVSAFFDFTLSCFSGISCTVYPAIVRVSPSLKKISEYFRLTSRLQSFSRLIIPTLLPSSCLVRVSLYFFFPILILHRSPWRDILVPNISLLFFHAPAACFLRIVLLPSPIYLILSLSLPLLCMGHLKR